RLLQLLTVSRQQLQTDQHGTDAEHSHEVDHRRVFARVDTKRACHDARHHECSKTVDEPDGTERAGRLCSRESHPASVSKSSSPVGSMCAVPFIAWRSSDMRL